MKTKEAKTRNRGVTLIALVVTIIVLLILAGVTIATLTGENGILTRASESAQRTEESNEEELRKLTALEAATNVDGTTHVDSSTGTETTVKIPAGFAVSQVEGENTLGDGLVIIDSNGNEWVWVEVPRTAEVYPTAGINLDVNNITNEQCSTIYEDLANYANAYRDSNYSDTFYSTEQHGFADADEYNTVKNNMLRSVYKNGGFWIGRYEIGSFDNPVKSNDTTRKPVIQKGAYPYNYITCIQAQQIANNLKPLNSEDYTSSLMFGIQWDLVCKFIEEKTDVTESEINSNSCSWGNYTDSQIRGLTGKYARYDNNNLLGDWDVIPQDFEKSVESMLFTTGASQYMKKMNIYDFAGNLYEYTLSSYMLPTDYICIGRGGFFGTTTVVPASRIW